MSDTQRPPDAEDSKTLDAEDSRTVNGRLARNSTTHEPPTPSPLPVPGQRLVKRYAVLQMLGEGGMGVVLAAYDEQLDRRVALKLLRQVHADNSTLEARLVREAQAMARLNHPHVVAVYDSGRLEDGTFFIAMEYVAGVTLHAWCQQKERSWREVLGSYLEAGRGLAAAHAVGIIHRDFKPVNVLVGRDGRVRVTDFGVARLDASSKPDSLVSRPLVAWKSPLTLPGHVVGTPYYLAPELLNGQPADARSDLFSFCVALYEALYGQAPFVGATANERMRARLEGRLNPPPANTQVPDWLGRAVMQGLCAEPEKRPASMHELIAALQKDQEASKTLQKDQEVSKGAWLRRGLWMGGVVALVGSWVKNGAWLRRGLWVGGAVALMGLGMWGGGRWQSHGCSAMDRRLVGVWDAPMKARMREALVGTGLSYAADTAQRIEAILDRYAGAWVKMNQEVCEATANRAEQARGLMVLREGCLERRRSQLKSLTELFAGRPDPVLVPKALQAAQALPSLESCTDEKALLAAVPLPEEPALRARVEQLQQQLDRLDALFLVGKYATELSLADKVLSDVEGVDFPPLRARALFYVAEFKRATGDYKSAEARVREAIPLAARGGDTLLLARAWNLLTFVMQYRQNGPQEVLGLELALETVMELSRDDLFRALALNNLGSVLRNMGRYEEALTRYERALLLKEKVLGTVHPEVGTSLDALGIVLLEMGRYEEALQHLDRALALKKKALGPEHPEVAGVLNNLGNVLRNMGRYDEALAMHERCLTLRQKALGPNHPDVATSLANQVNVLLDMGRYEKALELYERSLSLYEKSLGPEHPVVASLLAIQGSVLRNLGRYEEALALYERSLALKEKALGPEHPDVASLLASQGIVLRNLGRYEEALALLERSLTLRQKSLGLEHPKVASSLESKGNVFQEMGRYEGALALHERALALRQKALWPEHPAMVASLTNLGNVLIKMGRYKNALPYLESALVLEEKVLGPEHPDVAETLSRLGELHLAQRRPIHAVALLERALALLRTHDKAEVQLLLARALWESGGDKSRAVKLATQAHAQWQARKYHRQSEAAQWMASHTLP